MLTKTDLAKVNEKLNTDDYSSISADKMAEEAIAHFFRPFNSVKNNNDHLKHLFDVILGQYGSAQFQSLESLNKGKICNNCNEDIIKQLDSNAKQIEDLSILNGNLTRKSVLMQQKLKESLPLHSICFMLVTAISFTSFSFLYLLQYFKGIFIIHPYLTFTGCIGSIGLFITSALAIKDWKEHIQNDKK